MRSEAITSTELSRIRLSEHGFAVQYFYGAISRCRHFGFSCRLAPQHQSHEGAHRCMQMFTELISM